jgi:hypothetical protein
MVCEREYEGWDISYYVCVFVWEDLDNKVALRFSFQSWLHCLLVVRSQTNYLAALNLSFIICRMEIEICTSFNED